MKSSRYLFIYLFIFLCINTDGQAWAGVVMTGSRIIYSERAKDYSIQFSNKDEFPNIIQIWTDVDNPESTPETANGPFAIFPSVFKINPMGGQMARLLYTGAKAPSDRESIYYLNFLQIPLVNKIDDSNKMLVMLRSRLKIFYRPDGISGSPHNVVNTLKFKLVHQKDGLYIFATNNSGYYASLVNGKLTLSGEDFTVPVNMIPPYETSRWYVGNNIAMPNYNPISKFHFTLVNDQGGMVTKEYIINNIGDDL
ncbi:fimbria/pilus periplasmic chaperone [Aeromonas salmonicida]|uniref:fimbria/pilus periplasmic chaperone n=1 Tax=Aeromonas salmonicida TaxID=645 RepID=UPI00223F5737|nr:fimbria/pilus periplasmic chaperone [Aeromonas salmonicida]